MPYRETVQQQFALPHVPSSGFPPPGTRDVVAWQLVSMVKSGRLTPIHSHAGEESTCVEAASVHGMATIWNAAILVWAASQTIHAQARRLQPRRLVAAKQQQTLIFMSLRKRRHVHSRIAAREQPSPYTAKRRKTCLLRPGIES
ncbi:replication initiator protein A [Mesorhizobium sp. M0894]|uniref:replication initiator protein A n=1 Tax=unclassified Mesorhizobium TaxID=325217 RepID=UPI00333D42FC